MRPSPTAFLPLPEPVFLIALALHIAPRHGYGIMSDVSARSQGHIELRAGTLYRHLKRMLDDGIIAECDAPRNETSADERRRYYRLTDLGSAVLDAETQRMAKLVRAARMVAAGGRPKLA